MLAMRDIGSLFADYATYHRTPGNKWFHRFGIPLIMLSGLGMLARIPIVPYVDAAVVLIAIASVIYFILDWRLAVMMVIVSIAFYFAGGAVPWTTHCSSATNNARNAGAALCGLRGLAQAPGALVNPARPACWVPAIR